MNHFDGDKVTQDPLLIIDEITLSICHAKGFQELLSCPHEVIVVHMVATSVVCHLNVPGLWEHLDLLRVNALYELEMSLTKLKVVESELHTNEVQSQVE